MATKTKSRVTPKKAKTERELAETRIRELKAELAGAIDEVALLEDEEHYKKVKTKKVYARVTGAYYFSALVPAGEVEVYENEEGILVTDWDTAEIGREAFRAAFDEGGDYPFKIQGYMTEGGFDASDYDDYELYLDKSATKAIGGVR